MKGMLFHHGETLSSVYIDSKKIKLIIDNFMTRLIKCNKTETRWNVYYLHVKDSDSEKGKKWKIHYKLWYAH